MRAVAALIPYARNGPHPFDRANRSDRRPVPVSTRDVRQLPGDWHRCDGCVQQFANPCLVGGSKLAAALPDALL
jgi:hypothetical protein